MTRWSAIVLAAGVGSRMRSSRPKLLHRVAGRTLLDGVLAAIDGAGVQQRIVVLGPATTALREAVAGRAEIAVQAVARGTADAVQAAASLAMGEQILVLNGDLPLILPETLARLQQTHVQSEAVLTLLTGIAADPAGLGRVRRDASGRVSAVVEERDASNELLAVTEINAGVYCFRADWLWQRLGQIQPSQATGELYLTELVRIAAEAGVRVRAVTAGMDEIRGVNTQAELALAEAIARRRIQERLLAEGVTLIDPATAYIDHDVRIGMDSVVQPNTCIWGATVIGEGCEIGPNTIIRASQVGSHCRILASVLEEAEVEDDVSIGPFSHLRPGASIGRGSELGNYAEVKQSRLGPGTRMHHFSYIGDASIGADVNISAGVITCNFDGKEKHRTTVGASAFLGCDTMLVAPVSVGAQAFTAAGSVITHDVESGMLVVGVPAKPRRRIQAAEAAESAEQA